MGQLYGDALYYATSFFDHAVNGISYSRPEAVYFWFYFVGCNAVSFLLLFFFTFYFLEKKIGDLREEEEEEEEEEEKKRKGEWNVNERPLLYSTTNQPFLAM